MHSTKSRLVVLGISAIIFAGIPIAEASASGPLAFFGAAGGTAVRGAAGAAAAAATRGSLSRSAAHGFVRGVAHSAGQDAYNYAREYAPQYPTQQYISAPTGYSTPTGHSASTGYSKPMAAPQGQTICCCQTQTRVIYYYR
jgi:hypothetical protein